MKIKWISHLTGENSIRGRMLWSFVLSLVCASFFTTLLSDTVNRRITFASSSYYPYFAVLFFLLVFFVCFFLFTRRTVRYVKTLTEGLAVIALGKLDHRIPATREDELGRVAENINSMAAKLERLLENERQLEKSKMELITGVSHDLRTPLTSIIGYLELLKGKAYRDEAELERFIGNTHNKAQQMKMLIDELFEYTRLTQSGAKLALMTIDLREMLIQMLAEIEPLASDREIQIETNLTESPLFLMVDPEQIRRAIDNLLMNALKFSVRPSIIRVSMSVNDHQVTIMIENEADPITPDQEKRLFERFYKADESRTNIKLQGGAGLGLSITRSIVELHGGRIYLLRHEGHFKFGMELPIL